MKSDANLPIGPFALLDFIGLDTAQFIIAGWNKTYPYEELYQSSPIIDKLVAEGNLGKQSGKGFYTY
jgi:3-hydroxyacyl-CoA dehydrogenase